MSGIAKKDVLGVEGIKWAMLDALSSGRSRSFANIGTEVTKVLGLTRAQRSCRIDKGKASHFENRFPS